VWILGRAFSAAKSLLECLTVRVAPAGTKMAACSIAAILVHGRHRPPVMVPAGSYVQSHSNGRRCHRATVKLMAQAGQGKCAQCQADVAQSDVVKVSREQQVDDDAQ
jgi:hypothetical protein